jgi:hypothetical protein
MAENATAAGQRSGHCRTSHVTLASKSGSMFIGYDKNSCMSMETIS